MALTEQNMEGLISVSEKLREIVNRVGRASTWLFSSLSYNYNVGCCC